MIENQFGAGEHPTVDALPKADTYVLVLMIYDLHKTLRMNALYYGKRLQQVKRFNLILGIGFIVCGLTTAVLIIRPNGSIIGVGLLVMIPLMAAILGVIEPILPFSPIVERYSKLWSAYIALSRETGRIVEDLQVFKSVQPYMERTYKEVRDQFDVISKRDDDPFPDMKLLQEQQSVVEAELPIDRFWFPN